MQKVFWLSVVLFASVMPAAAAEMLMEPIVVTATKTEQPINQVASSVTVITREEIEKKQPIHVLDLLRSVPALDVVRAGGMGQQTSVFLRGANSSHTLVLIDGIEMNDPSNPTRSFDFANLSTDNIERIEILRGPGSTLYGSDAIGGVINIISRKGSGAPQTDLFAEAGSSRAKQGRVSFNGGTELVNYALTASYLHTDGVSAAGEKYGNREDDGYERKEIATRFGLTPVDDFDLDFILRYNDSETDLDNFGGPGGDDPNNIFYSRSTLARVQGRLFLFDGIWEQTLGFSMTDYDRSNRNKTDVDHPFETTRTSYDSQIYKTEWQNNLYLNHSNILTAGIEYEEEHAKGSDYRTFLDWLTFLPASSSNEFGRKTARTTGYYVQDQITLGDNFLATLGMRVDDHNRFGTEETYRATASYLVPQTQTRFKGSCGTAFKAPTLAQLYENSGFVVGNPDLSPEESWGWDAGVEQSFYDSRLVLGATYFENKFDDLINTAYNPVTFKFEYENIDEAKTSGVELTLSLTPLDGLNLMASYTYTDTEDCETDDQLLRRPRNKFNVNVNYQFLEQGNLNIDVIYVGKRDDYAYPENVTLDAYAVTNLAASWKFSEAFALSGRVENLFDEDYEEVFGFGTPGTAGYLGVNFKF